MELYGHFLDQDDTCEDGNARQIGDQPAVDQEERASQHDDPQNRVDFSVEIAFTGTADQKNADYRGYNDLYTGKQGYMD